MGCLCLTFLEEYLLRHGCSLDGVAHTLKTSPREGSRGLRL
jgi:hypothetical protein